MARKLVIPFLLALCTQAVGEEYGLNAEFNYGLWGKPASAFKQEEKPQPKKESKKKEQKKERKITWKDYLSKDIPYPVLRALENPTIENVREARRAYREFVERYSKFAQLLKLLEIEEAQKVSKRYKLVYFFSPECPVCKEVTPKFFSELYRNGFTPKVNAYTVSNLKTAIPYMAQFGVSTTRIATDRLLEEYGVIKDGVIKVPALFVLDETGAIVKEFVGIDVLDAVNFLKEKTYEKGSSTADSSNGK